MVKWIRPNMHPVNIAIGAFSLGCFAYAVFNINEWSVLAALLVHTLCEMVEVK